MVFDKTQKNVREFFKKNFSNKIVLIGSTVPADLDIKKTPFGQMPGVEVHANAINSIINNFYLINIKKQYNSIFTFVVCFLISFFLFTQKGTSGQKISLLVILFFVLFAIYLFTIKDLIVNMTMPVVGGILSYIVSFLYKYSIEDREKEKVRKLFERYVSTPVVNKILEDPRSIKLGGHETKVSILFSDINGFTALSEELSPAEVIQLLNEYFELMIESVFKHHGTLKQFVGDEIMAIYGAPYVLENSSLQAAYTSLDMMKKLNVWKEKKKTEGKRCFDIKIGLNCGNVICGNVGSEKRTEYAAVGDVVNTASRIMNLYSTVKPVTGILASKDFYEEIREKINCRYLGAFPVKGKNSIIDIYELLSEKEL
jgi:adenylate cyclase